jgi:hypothetical protein
MVTSVLELCWGSNSIKLIGYGTEKNVGYEVQPNWQPKNVQKRIRVLQKSLKAARDAYNWGALVQWCATMLVRCSIQL